VAKRAIDVLVELGLTIKEIDLYSANLPYYDGAEHEEAGRIIGELRNASGVIIAAATVLPSVPAMVQTLFEHLTLSKYADTMINKNCMLLVVSEAGGERACLDNLAGLLQSFKAFDSVRIGLQASDVDQIDENEEIRDVFERQLEDYFRMVRQSRRFFIPSDHPKHMIEAQTPIISEKEREALTNIEKKRKQPLSVIAKKLNLDHIDENQSKHINEISSFFTKKMTEHYQTDSTSPVYVKSLAREPHIHIAANCKQLSKSLTHYFQPQLAQGLSAVLQLQVSGTENFSGYYTINNTECAFIDGTAQNPDITILSDATVWQDVLTGKCSAQKAFMIGRLKVKGNYVLLTKFDHIFKVSG
jgi:putative sterol carrier protein/NAD(P)H-dependent FMN reductase